MADKLQKEKGIKLAPRGMSRRLAAKYGVSLRTIEHIRSRTRWQDILGKPYDPRAPKKRVLRPRIPIPSE
jgi:hypothetical protein